jgi:glutathione S-transferase
MYQFYYASGSCSFASHLALEMSGAPYKAIKLNLATNAQREDQYLKINPKGRVPALVCDEGILTENPAILLYLAQQFPDAKLAPINNAFELAKVNAFNAYLSSTVHPAHSHGVRGIRWADDGAAIAELKRKMPEVMTECFGMIENEMFKGPWVTGDDFSISDIYLFTIAQWLEADRVDITQFPNVMDHRLRMRNMVVVKAVLALQ